MTRTCSTETETFVTHVLDLPPMCPVSGNPRPGSGVAVCYRPNGVVFPVEDLEAFIREYIGGRGAVRGMEEMVQELAQRVAEIVKVPVRVIADLTIQPPYGGNLQRMRVTARAR